MLKKLIGASALALALATTLQSPATADASMTVTPSTGLTDGQVVQAAVSGLNPGTTYRLGQCAEVEPGKFACSFPDIVEGQADAGGNFSTPLTVRATFPGVLFDGTAWGTVDCKVHSCEVGIGDLDLNHAADVPISFQ
ncbi:hypothetical protein GCM10009678_53930 [Actinomadura kijaniata]|uniref:Neocarzinostatin n=1 Tax=Actinomadura namibiensis TaxID=182080 RepID=A0A7W3LRP1_ACTNM|nr:enediyne antibiotic chromoprotein [Actinomadura namibiensis]MBA8953045.1 hypothetical protein [Actinomadura namibiensis]